MLGAFPLFWEESPQLPNKRNKKARGIHLGEIDIGLSNLFCAHHLGAKLKEYHDFIFASKFLASTLGRLDVLLRQLQPDRSLDKQKESRETLTFIVVWRTHYFVFRQTTIEFVSTFQSLIVNVKRL